jgi:uncharacterized protein
MTVLFFVISFFYSMVGLGGGSSYVAILALMDIPYEQIPFISLICNLIVVGSGSFHYLRGGHFRSKLFFPVMLGSIPMAFIGGSIPISKQFFLLLLGFTLVLMGLRLFWGNYWKKSQSEIRHCQPILGVLIGSGLGILSGLLGIGGGIFLSPILLLLRWGTPKEVAATASVFVFFNSLSALFGHLMRHSQHLLLNEYWPLFFVVIVGGQLGSILGSRKVSQRAIGNLTAILVFFVGCRTLLKAWV